MRVTATVKTLVITSLGVLIEQAPTYRYLCSGNIADVVITFSDMNSDADFSSWIATLTSGATKLVQMTINPSIYDIADALNEIWVHLKAKDSNNITEERVVW